MPLLMQGKQKARKVRIQCSYEGQRFPDYEAGKGPIRGYESNGMGILFHMSEDLGDDMIITVRSNRALTLMTISPPYNW